jgi:hypothetical protein
VTASDHLEVELGFRQVHVNDLLGGALRKLVGLDPVPVELALGHQLIVQLLPLEDSQLGLAQRLAQLLVDLPPPCALVPVLVYLFASILFILFALFDQFNLFMQFIQFDLLDLFTLFTLFD